ncbi:MAG: shikimate kinase [Duncaniella sp.]|nr:shikimate kinase [Muribaculum sp.]MCM1255352.1 shikimate kinase [Duncaniella sp.]
MKPIFLIGYMGCGKSTLGKGLAARCDIRFIDLDNYIEEQAGMTIKELFASQGEAAFRDLERRMLQEVSRLDNVVVACGGGTPCFGDNMEVMNRYGVTVLLRTSHERLFERLKRGRHKRPLIANLDDEQLDRFIAEQLEKRMVHYTKAKETFDSTTLEDENQIDDKCNLFISRFKLPRK